MLIKQFQGFLDTPPLWINEQFGIQQFDFLKVDLQHFNPKPIPQNRRLGHQMEYVFHQLIEYMGNHQVLAHNIPIRDGKQTIGEIDFILKEAESEKLLHVELTYKFYIINPEITEPIHRLMGPNKRDMFFTKMEKIKNEQFSLLHSEQGGSALQALGINHANISHQACYKAQLFVPYKTTAINIRPLNKHCIVGYWLRFDDFNASEFKPFQYYIPYKSQWVIAPHNDVAWSSHFDMLLEINLRMLKENAPMVWVRKSETEFEKFFVVWW